MTARQHQGMRDLVAKMKSKGINQALIDAMLSNDPDEGRDSAVLLQQRWGGGSKSDVEISNETALHCRKYCNQM